MKGKQFYLFGPQMNSKEGIAKYLAILTQGKVILSLISLTIVITIIFSLGVERGKRIALRDLETKEKTEARVKIPSESPDIGRLPQTESVIEPEVQEPLDLDAQDAKDEEKERFRIQVASFHKENTAHKEARRLEENGYPVLVLQKGKFMVVYVGTFETKSEAENNFQSLKQRYKDCILRRL
jgi:cell division protein FtsN